MTEQLFELLKEVNIVQIIAILGAMWIFYNRLDRKIEKLGDKVEDLDRRLCDVDRRLCRIEGSLSTHGACLFNQAATEKKAQ